MEKEKIKISPVTACLAVCLGVLIVLGISALITMVAYRKSQREKQTYVLGNADTCGYIGVSIKYDTEPVDISLYDPAGYEFQPTKMSSSYTVDETAKTITFLIDSEKLGTWSVAFNTKKNKKIEYSFIQMPSDTLYMTQPSIIMNEDGVYCLKFATTVACDEGATGKCSAYLEKTDFSVSVAYEDIPLNEEVQVPLEFPDHVFTDEDYRMKIAVSTEKGQSDRAYIDVHIDYHKAVTKQTDAEKNDENDEDGKGNEDAYSE